MQLYCKLTKSLAVDAGGRNEETYSKYAAGARIKQRPSRRQQQRGAQNEWLAGYRSQSRQLRRVFYGPILVGLTALSAPYGRSKTVQTEAETADSGGADGNAYILWRKINLKWFDCVLFMGIIFKQAELAVGSL